MPDAIGPRRETLALYGALVALSVAFRAPALVNAATVDSDAAIVGIQARHILRGELRWFLYGSGYQTSIDSAVAALFFAVLGATSLALLLSTLAGHVTLTCLVLATLRRCLGPGRPYAAFVATLPLVFTSSPLHTYILNAPRQASLTIAFLALFVLDRASARTSARARLAHHAAGGAIASLACFADPYALLFLPALLLFGALAAWDAPPTLSCRGRAGGRSVPRASELTRVAATLVGALFGILPLLALLHRPGAVRGEATLTLAVLGHNWALFRDTCLPWLLGTTVFVPHALLGYAPWPSGSALHAVSVVGAIVFVLAIASGGAALVRREVPWPVRRLGGFGCVMAILTVASFMLSVMVMDLFSSRYLAALVLASPLALAPLAHVWGARRLLATLAPYLVSAGLCGWLGYGNEVNGAAIVALPGHGAADEDRLEELLRERGVAYAIADYWVSYRLTFLYSEAIAVVPIHEREDRYPPYRAAYRAAARSAYVFDPKRSREDFLAMKKEAFEGAAPWGTPIEEIHSGALTAVVFDRREVKDARPPPP